MKQDDTRKKIIDLRKVQLDTKKKEVKKEQVQKIEVTEEPPAKEFIEKLAHPENDNLVIHQYDEPSWADEDGRRAKLRKFIWLSGGCAAVLVLLFVLFSTVFAKVTVTIKPKVETIAVKNVSVAFDSSASKVMLQEKIIPAERLEFSKTLSREFEATGRSFVEEKARGKAKIYNAHSSSSQSLVANTRFLTDTGILYRLSKAVAIPGAEVKAGKIVPTFVEVELVADQPGEEGNIANGLTLKIPGFQGSPKYQGFYGVTASAFSGGFRGDARVVSKDDVKKAQEEVTKEVYSDLQKDIVRKVPPDFVLLDALREIQITKVDIPRENTKRDRFTAEVKALGGVIVFREKDVAQFAQFALVKDENKELKDGVSALRYRAGKPDFDKGKVAVSLDGNLPVKSVVEVEEIARLLAGSREQAMADALRQRSEIGAFRVAFFPPWLWKAPSSKDKITIVIENP